MWDFKWTPPGRGLWIMGTRFMYEEITAAEYEKMTQQLRPLKGSLPHEEELEARFCEGGVCEVQPDQVP